MKSSDTKSGRKKVRKAEVSVSAAVSAAVGAKVGDMNGETSPAKTSRIQRKNRTLILDAALEVFSMHGFKGSTLDQIAEEAKISKPNLIYYYRNKESIYTALLIKLLDTWVDPIVNINPEGDPIEEMLAYVDTKLDMSRDFPRESRLFAGEIMRGAPFLTEYLNVDLKDLLDEKAQLIRDWVKQGKIADIDPHHLMFTIWSVTQHYADFEVQIEALLKAPRKTSIEQARKFQHMMFRKLLTP